MDRAPSWHQLLHPNRMYDSHTQRGHGNILLTPCGPLSPLLAFFFFSCCLSTLWPRVVKRKLSKQQKSCRTKSTITVISSRWLTLSFSGSRTNQSRMYLLPITSARSDLTFLFLSFRLTDGKMFLWIDLIISSRYLDAVIHLNYVLLRMLEKYSKSNSYMYYRKRTAKRARRKRSESIHQRCI